MYSKNKDNKIENLKIRKNFEVVNPRTDIHETLLLMKKEDVDFIIVKDNKNFIGLITKREITEIEPLLFESFNRTT